MSGGKRARSRHHHVALDRHAVHRPFRAPASTQRLQQPVDDRRGDGNRNHPVERGPATAWAAGDGEDGGASQPELRVIGRPREAAECAIEGRRRRCRDRRVHRRVDPRQLVDPGDAGLCLRCGCHALIVSRTGVRHSWHPTASSIWLPAAKRIRFQAAHSALREKQACRFHAKAEVSCAQRRSPADEDRASPFGRRTRC